MARKIIGILLSVIMVLAFAAMPANAAAGPDSLSVTDISDQLVCQCGCTKILSNCTQLECRSREQMTSFIVQELGRGQTGPQIIQAFVRQYGEQVLASPVKKGFNLVVWILPFAAILAGGAVIYIALKKWVWRGALEASAVENETGDINDEYRLRLEEDLRKFTGSGFR